MQWTRPLTALLTFRDDGARRLTRRRPVRGRAVRLGLIALVAALLSPLSPGPATAVPAPAPVEAAATSFDGKPVQYWNGVLLDVARRVPGISPGPYSRAAAMLNTAIYDAESAYQRTWHTMQYQPYLDAPVYAVWPMQEGPDEEERVIGFTARQLLVKLFPAQETYINQSFQDRFGNPWTDFDILKSLVAAPVADAIYNARYDDGSDNRDSYNVQNVQGAWRPTGGACLQESNAVDPNWGKVEPFAIPSGSYYRPHTPELAADYATLLATPAYQQQVDEVRRLGSATSTERTPEQTAAAWFWANDAGGTYKPPGQLLEITGTIAAQQGLNVYRTSRLFAMLSLSMADAAIASWDAKYATPIDLWRPISAIREGIGDTSWQPLGSTPCFPAWVSGHATFAGAWAATLRSVLNTDQITFTASTDDPATPVKQRTFTSISQAAEEDAMSRLWLGVHYRWDAEDGMALGKNVGDYVTGHYLLPV